MKSFLEDINDSSLTWPADADEDDVSSFFSASSYSSSDDEYDRNDDLAGGAAAAEAPGAVVRAVDEIGAGDAIEQQVAIPQEIRVADPEENILGGGGAAVAVAAVPEAVALADQVVNGFGEEDDDAENNISNNGNGIDGSNHGLVPVAPEGRININIDNEMHHGTNNPIHENLRNHPLSTTMLFRVARCEELPLIRAEIDWKLLQKQIPTYPNAQVGDELGAHLLQSVLRNDPPCEVIRDIIQQYPKSCVNMDSFYAACQYASDDAVLLLMRLTMKARRIEGISWGMLAFLGDARIGIRHARFLLECAPESLVDPMHGMFGVSPLDRMMSGAFIHGGYDEWVEKLKLALWRAEKRPLSEWGNHPFFPFHVLVKRLVSSDFMGVQFGAFSFVHSLTAFIEAEANVGSGGVSIPPPAQLDEKGNLPLHIILQNVCHTNLGATGERKLIKFLLQSYPESTTIRDYDGKLPIVLAVENGWPVYDIIANHCPAEYTEGIVDDDSNDSDHITNIENLNQNNNYPRRYKDLLIHDVLRCKFHPRFCVKGARSLIKSLLKKYPSSVRLPNQEGCLPLHLAIENGWPCHDLLVAAYPCALEKIDPRTDFYPFHFAATAEMQVVEEDKSQTELSTLYELIKLGPMLLWKGKNNEEPLIFENNEHTKRKIVETTISYDEPPQKKRC